MRVTIADVAVRAGVSKTTVSRVLNGKPDLDERTAARVRQVIDELGYVPSSGAVGLARGRTRLVGLLVPSLRWPWMGDLLQGAVDLLESQAYGLLLFTCHRGDESMRRFSLQVSARSFDGLLVIEPEGAMDYIAGLHRRGLPVVLIDDRARHPRFPSVSTTNTEGGAQAARHLLRIGRSRPAMVSAPQAYGCARERAAGFGDVFADAGLPVAPGAVVDGRFSFEGGRRAVAQLLASGAAFDSLFAHNDLSAAGAIHALRAAGVRIPDDVAVVGFDDIPLAGHTDPPLTTIHQPLQEMGAAAARMLVGAMTGSGADDREVLPTSLVARASTVGGRPVTACGETSGADGTAPVSGRVPAVAAVTADGSA